MHLCVQFFIHSFFRDEFFFQQMDFPKHTDKVREKKNRYRSMLLLVRFQFSCWLIEYQVLRINELKTRNTRDGELSWFTRTETGLKNSNIQSGALLLRWFWMVIQYFFFFWEYFFSWSSFSFRSFIYILQNFFLQINYLYKLIKDNCRFDWMKIFYIKTAYKVSVRLWISYCKKIYIYVQIVSWANELSPKIVEFFC